MDQDQLVNGDPEFVLSILNAVNGQGELPTGVKIVDKLEVDAEIKSIFDALKQAPTFAEDTKDNPNLYEYEIKEDLAGVVPIEAYTVVTDGAGHGIVALPKLIIVFEAGGDLQMVNSDPIWFVFSNIAIADEIVIETQEIVEGLYSEEVIEDDNVAEVK